MEPKKKILPTAITSALGVCIANPAQSVGVAQFTVRDVGSTLAGVDGSFSAVLDGNSGGWKTGAADHQSHDVR